MKGGTLNMSRTAKRAYISLLGLIGLVILLVGLFTEAYDFMIGLIIAIAIWVGSGILARYWGVKKDKS